MTNEGVPVPVETKRKRATLRSDRARPARSPRQAAPIPEPPPIIRDEIATAEWRRVVPSLVANGLFTAAHETLLAGYCNAVASAVRAEETLASEGRYFETRGAMRRRHPAVQDALESWQAARSFARQLGITGGGIVEAEGNERRAAFK
jgi:P27 family predicted phage terminase small subunit